MFPLCVHLSRAEGVCGETCPHYLPASPCPWEPAHTIPFNSHSVSYHPHFTGEETEFQSCQSSYIAVNVGGRIGRTRLDHLQLVLLPVGILFPGSCILHPGLLKKAVGTTQSRVEGDRLKAERHPGGL